MSEIKKIFYNIFWQNQACRNLFLLSKEELLDTKGIDSDEGELSVSFPRIIISNISPTDQHHETIRYRTESSIIRSEAHLSNKFKAYEPLITNFIQSKFGKSLEKFAKDVNESPGKILKLIAKGILANPERREQILIKTLQEYGFIGKQICSLKQLDEYISKEGNKNLKSIMSEENVWNIYAFLKSIKDVYINQIFQDLYTSNQVLVNALFNEDNFEDRIRLFHLLFESQVLTSSNEDSFIECTSCSPGVFRGGIQLKIAPNRLQKLRCPSCDGQLTYYVPYQLNEEIYKIIKSKDGLLLDALRNFLDQRKIQYKCNVNELTDIEFDCKFAYKGLSYIVETKMFKSETTREKLTSKVKEAYCRLATNVQRTHGETEAIIPLLLVNVPDSKMLGEILHGLKTINIDPLIQNGYIVNIDTMNSALDI